MEEIEGRVAVVTGGASGMGAATAKLLADKGATVATWDVAQGADIRCDVSDPGSVDSALRSTIDAYGPPTILVAAAGIVQSGPFVEISPGDWDRVIGVNLRGPFLCSQAIARELISRELKGSMVIVSSISGVVTDPQVTPYSVSKAGVLQLVRVVARELGEFNIRINAICPGPMERGVQVRIPPPPAGEEPGGRSAANQEKTRALVALGRLGRPEDIAEAILNVLSMSWVTGQVLAVDGGTSLVTPRGLGPGAIHALLESET